MIIKERSLVILPFHLPQPIAFIKLTQAVATNVKAALVLAIVFHLQLQVLAIQAKEVPFASVLGADLKLMEVLSSMSSSQRL